jgi:hypothetical protein
MASSHPNGHELRRYERHGFFCAVELTPLSGGAPHTGRSLDISLGGVGVATDGHFEVDELLHVAFLLKDPRGADVRERIDGRVARMHADVDANMLGIQFLNPLNEAEHPRLVGKILDL